MVIEKLRKEHVLQALALQQQIIPYNLDPDYASSNYEKLVQSEDCCILVAREGNELWGTVSGFCCRGLASDLLVIEDLIVSEAVRGSGIGTKLMTAIHQFGKKAGCDYAILVSSGFRKQAHQFYEKMGYIEDVRGFRKDL